MSCPATVDGNGWWYCQMPGGGLEYVEAWNRADAEVKCAERCNIVAPEPISWPGTPAPTVPIRAPGQPGRTPINLVPPELDEEEPPPTQTPGDPLQAIGEFLSFIPDPPPLLARFAPTVAPDDCAWCAATKRSVPWLLMLLVVWLLWRWLR